MENGFKMRISRMFRSTLSSCRPKDITADVIEQSPIFLSDSSSDHQHHRHHQLIELLSPRPPPHLSPQFSGHGDSKWPQTQTETNHNKKSLPSLTDAEGQKCPPVSPVSPFLNTFYDHRHRDRYLQTGPPSSSSSNAKEKARKTKKPKRVRSKIKAFGLHDEFPACSYNGLFSSDDGDGDEDSDDITTLFSSRSLSSVSSESLSRSRSCRMVQRTNSENFHHRHGQQKMKSGFKDDSEFTGRRSKSMLAGLKTEGKVKDSFAVVKCSSDPYNDFRASMVEMIQERQLYSADELENLLQCFLSLNAYQHHRVIVQVFTEIWEALFSNR